MTDPSPHLLEMRIRALVVDPATNTPVVVLQRPDEAVFLPIWIGAFEANAIALELEGVKTPRPMTHDLLAALIREAGWSIECISIHSLRDSVFIASIGLHDKEGGKHEVDSRPSDAIAIALRVGAPVLVSAEVLAQARVEEVDSEEALKLLLHRLRPEDLGKYEM